MKIRYCDKVPLIGSCEVGWGSLSGGEYHSCHDEPKEKNCRYLVEDDTKTGSIRVEEKKDGQARGKMRGL